MISPRATLVRNLHQVLEPLHAVTYFSPEPLAALADAGYRGFWMGYFAGRAAPFGVVPADVVAAAFYNFSETRVHRALPDAWSYASPEAALRARLDGSVAALRRLLGDLAESPGVSQAAELAGRAALTAPLEGRPLFAANRSLAAPGEPLARLWHAATLLREHRGDGHVAALLVAGIGGRESHVLHALATGLPAAVHEVARDLHHDERDAIIAGLTARGLSDGTGLTPAGRTLKDDVETHTDDLAAQAYAALDDDELDALLDALSPLARAVVAGGDIPLQSPMGLDLSDLTQN